MKDDNGKEWTRKDYGMASVLIILIISAILAPVALLLLFNYLTGWRWYWPSFWVVFCGIFVFNIWYNFYAERRRKEALAKFEKSLADLRKAHEKYMKGVE